MEMLTTVIGQGHREAPKETYTTSRMQVAHMPEGSSFKESLTQAKVD